jgi:hypothetical protein
MKNFSKAIAMVALIATAAAPAFAGKVSSPVAGTAVTVEGDLNMGLGGVGLAVCHVKAQGVTDATGITINSYTGTLTSGFPLDCNSGLVMPLRIEATSATKITLKNMKIVTRIGTCGPKDAFMDWSNTTSTASGTGMVGACSAETTNFKVSPAVKIAD